MEKGIVLADDEKEYLVVSVISIARFRTSEICTGDISDLRDGLFDETGGRFGAATNIQVTRRRGMMRIGEHVGDAPSGRREICHDCTSDTGRAALW